jgi:hypothetical protein
MLPKNTLVDVEGVAPGPSFAARRWMKALSYVCSGTYLTPCASALR